jgi:hypothetical protein
LPIGELNIDSTKVDRSQLDSTREQNQSTIGNWQ